MPSLYSIPFFLYCSSLHAPFLARGYSTMDLPAALEIQWTSNRDNSFQ